MLARSARNFKNSTYGKCFQNDKLEHQQKKLHLIIRPVYALQSHFGVTDSSVISLHLFDLSYIIHHVLQRLLVGWSWIVYLVSKRRCSSTLKTSRRYQCEFWAHFFLLLTQRHTSFPSKFPYGKSHTIIALIFSIAAYGCAVNTTYDCHLVSGDTAPALDSIFRYPPQGQTFGLGLSRFEETFQNDDCVTGTQSAYDKILDVKWKAAAWMAVCANVCLRISMISIICMTCMALPAKIIKVIGLLLFFGFFFESLVFIIYSSDVCRTFACSFSARSGTGVAAMILALLSAAVVCNFPPYVDDFLPGTIQDTETPRTLTIKTII